MNATVTLPVVPVLAAQPLGGLVAILDRYILFLDARIAADRATLARMQWERDRIGGQSVPNPEERPWRRHL